MSHKLVGSFTARSYELEGTIDMKEIECGGKFVSVEFGANYCPKCGEAL